MRAVGFLRGAMVALGLTVLGAAPSSAAVFTVDRTDDDASATACTVAANDCSLRGAIIAANAAPGSTISIPAGTYQLTIVGNTNPTTLETAGDPSVGDLDVTADNTTITGAGAADTIIQQTTVNDRVIEVNPFATTGFDFHISGVTIKGGRETTGVGGAGLISGAMNSHTFVDNVIFSDNRATGGVGTPVGGAIGNTNGELAVTGSVFRSNTAAGEGGAVFFDGGADSGMLSVQKSSFVANVSGSIALGGGAISISGPVTSADIKLSSFQGNQATAATGGGGAVANSSPAVLSVAWSRFAGNTAATAANGTAIRNTWPGGLTANDNWWGSDAGPAANAIVSEVAVTPASWLQMRFSTNPTSLLVGEASQLTADIYARNTGGALPANTLVGLPAFPDPAGTVFSGVTLGALSSASTQFVDGVATATFTANSAPGGGTVTATADSQTQLVTIAITANTTTTVASSVNPSTFGQPVTFTATISPVAPGTGVPTGSVQFTIDGGASTTVGLVGGQALLMISSLAAGTHTVDVSYLGGGGYNTSSGFLAGGQTVDKADTTTGLASSANPSVLTQSVTFTATVTPVAPGGGTPVGSVTFTDTTTATVLGTVSLDGSGQAAVTASALGLGSHAISASYGGNGNYNGSSGSLTQTVNKADSATTLGSSANPSVFGQPVTFTATVTAAAPASGTPTGSVTFTDTTTATVLGTVTLDGTGHASVVTSALAVGTHAISAAYAGDATYNTSSGGLSQVVDKASTTTAVVSSVNPSVFGQPVTFTATVAPVVPGAGSPTGSVTFTDTTTATALGTVALDGAGQAVVSTSSLAVGSHAVSAVYAGDGSFSTSTGGLTQVVNKADTTTAVASSVNPSVFGQSVTFTATVATTGPGAGTPTGSVVFLIDGTPGAPIALDGSGHATFTTALLAVAGSPHTVTANYQGGTSHNTSTGALAGGQAVNKAGTTTALTSSLNPSVFGQTVTFTAQVTPVAPGAGTPTGSVTFTDGATPLGTVAVNGSGQAALVTSTLGGGAHTITATYNGDGSFNGSASSGLTQNVSTAASLTVVGSSLNPSVAGQSVTFTATVTTGGGPLTVGTVTFKDGAATLQGPVALNGSGQVAFTTSALAPGSHAIVAEYSGTPDFAASSASVSQFVKATTVSVVSTSANPAVVGQSVTLTVTVSSGTPGVPSGTVTIMDGATTLGTPALDGTGHASVTTSSLTLGPHPITATYAGDAAFNGSVSSTLSQVVDKAATSVAVASSVNPSGIGQSVTFTATVTAAAPGSGTPTGSVTFKDGAATLGTVTLDGTGKATFTTSSLTVAPHTITVAYGGDSNYLASVSPSLVQRVGQAGGDFDGDGKADLLWRGVVGGGTGMPVVWRMNGLNVIGGGPLPTVDPAWEVKAIADFDGDGKTDILWRLRTTGQTYFWLMDGLTVRSSGYTLSQMDTSWTIAGAGDVDGDGKADLVWRGPGNGAVTVWLGGNVSATGGFGSGPVNSAWKIEAVADVNGDGRADLLWRQTTTGETYVWLMNGGSAVGQYTALAMGLTWAVAGTGDVDGDGKADVLWRRSSDGAVYLWPAGGLNPGTGVSLGTVDPAWVIRGVLDVNGDGRADLLWRQSASGSTYLWLMNGASVIGNGPTAAQADLSWEIQPR